MSKITPKKRNKKSYGGIIAIAVTIVLVVAVLGGVVLLYVNSNQKLGEALRPKTMTNMSINIHQNII